MKRKEFLKKGMVGMIGLTGMTTLLNACTKKTIEPVDDDDDSGDPGVETGGAPFSATHWVSASATGSGNGTQQNPYTLAQALQLAQPGWRVSCGPGEYMGVNTSSNTPSMRILANGTENNPIIFFAQNYAALNTTGRSILRHNGTRQGYGCPVLGLDTGHHWYGFYISESLAPTHPDTGPIVCGGKYNRISYFRIDRGPTTWPQERADNNHAAIRFEGQNGCQNNLVSDCWIENYSRQNAFRSEQGIQLFSPQGSNMATSTGRITIENCYFDNVETALTCKGAGADRWILGGIIFRRNLVRGSTFTNVAGAVNFMDTSGELGRNQVYQNIQVGGHYHVVCWNQAGYPIRDIDVINNTLIDCVANREIEGIHTAVHSSTRGSGWRIHNNIKTGTAPFFHFVFDDQSDAAVQSRSHNLSFGHTRWGYVDSRGTGTQSLAQWVANTPFDDFSLESDPQLASSVWGNANLGRLQQASPARNAAIDLLNLNGRGTSAACHMGAYSNDDVVIGIRPLV
jgi:hypothetical protein